MPRKLDPRKEKREVNERFAEKFGHKHKKRAKRLARRARTLERHRKHLIALGIDPCESEAPIA